MVDSATLRAGVQQHGRTALPVLVGVGGAYLCAGATSYVRTLLATSGAAGRRPCAEDELLRSDRSEQLATDVRVGLSTAMFGAAVTTTAALCAAWSASGLARGSA